MRQTFILWTTMGLTLLALVGPANAQMPEKRCLLSGSYIKVYGDTEEDKKETCARQGGEYTTYHPPRPNAGPSGPAEGFKAMMGQRGAGMPR